MGEEGQLRIARSRVGIAGCGGLGVNALTPLVEAGVTEFVLCDPAVPSVSDLNTQYIYAAGDIRPKCEIAAEWALALNCTVAAQAVPAEVAPDTVRMFEGCNAVLDCAGSRSASEALSAWCASSGTALVHAQVSGGGGRLFTQIPGGPTLADAMEAAGGPGGPAAAMGASTAVIASMQALEAVRVLAGQEPAFAGSVLKVDLGAMTFERVVLRRPRSERRTPPDRARGPGF